MSDDLNSTMISPLYDLNNLYDAYLCVKKASGWKETTQRYEEDFLFRLINLKASLTSHSYKPTPPHHFPYFERGKLRHIESYSIDDRIVQGCFINSVLLPIVRPKLIYDNSASLKGRGTDHFRRRLELHLKDFAKKHGNNGYILIADFTKYFDNLQHDYFLQVLKNFGADNDVLNFTKMLISTHEIDVSYMTDSQYANCMNEPFNAIEYAKIDRSRLTGQKFMRKSLGIGSPIAQIAGIVYPYLIDNYCKIVKGVKAYGRYMDDFYAIGESKEQMWELLANIKIICKRIGLFLNERKTQVISLKHSFTLLKTQYKLEPNGNIIKVADDSAITRCRRKLKKMKINLDVGIITKDKVEQTYKSTRNAMVTNGITTAKIESLDNFYKNLFNKGVTNYGTA